VDPKHFQEEKLHLSEVQGRLKDTKDVLEKSINQLGASNLEMLKEWMS
jgi:hypothetical protein